MVLLGILQESREIRGQGKVEQAIPKSLLHEAMLLLRRWWAHNLMTMLKDKRAPLKR